MSDFRNDIKTVIEALMKVGYNKDTAMDLLWEKNPRMFVEYFMGVDGGHYYINIYSARISISDSMKTKLMSKGTFFHHGEMEFAVENQKIATIKYVRALTGWHLKDAKEFVEGRTMKLTNEQASDLKSLFSEGFYKDEYADPNR
jgi:hypothetical protein